MHTLVSSPMEGLQKDKRMMTVKVERGPSLGYLSFVYVYVTVVHKRLKLILILIVYFVIYGDWEGPSLVHLVLSWPQHINSREHDNMLWPRYINSLQCDIMSWPRDVMLREQHIFLVATSLMRKQTYVTIATRYYQRGIH